MKGFLLFLLLAVASACIADRFDDFVKGAMEEQKIPGLQFGVIYKGKLVMNRSYGFAELEKKTPVDKDTLFEIASVSKPFIATATMMLWEQGKIKLDDPVGKYIADMPLAWSQVPVQNLLSHTSGIPEYRGGPLYFSKRLENPSLAEIAKNMSTDRLFDVGDHFAYSNTNYLLLGKAIEGVTGKPFTDYLQTKIFDVAGMARSGFVGTTQHAQGYTAAGKDFYAARDCSLIWAGPGSSIVSNVEEMAKFDAALGAGKLVRNGTINKMLEPTLTKLGPMDYALGWQVGHIGKSLVMLHSGKMNGFSSIYLRLPIEQISVIVLTNANDSDGNTLARGILGLYFPELDPQKLTPIVDDDPDTTRAHMALLLSIVRGKPDMDAFTDDYKQHVTEDKLQAVGAEIRRGGKLKPLQVLRRYRKGNFDVHAYLLTSGETQVIVSIFVDEKGKVGGLTLTTP